MATPRETLKYYFRKYALPTEQQFAELIDAFVHKDEDILTQEKIDGLVSELAGKVSKETFESFKTEIQGAITSSGGDLTALTNRMTTAEGNISSLREDVDTNTDNISGINQRVKTLEEKPEITVDKTLDAESTNPIENGTVTTALNQKADNSDVTALKERVSTLENAEPPTITGNFLKQIADLDSYEGSEGEIVQYIGATNDKYRRGFCYEKKAGESDVYYYQEGDGFSVYLRYGDNPGNIILVRGGEQYRYKGRLGQTINYRTDKDSETRTIDPYVFWDEQHDKYLYADKECLDDSEVAYVNDLERTNIGSKYVLFRHPLKRGGSEGELSWQVIPTSPCVN